MASSKLRAAFSRLRLKPTKQSSQALEKINNTTDKLPAEIVILILLYLTDRTDLSADVHACPRMHSICLMAREVIYTRLTVLELRERSVIFECPPHCAIYAIPAALEKAAGCGVIGRFSQSVL